MKKLILIDGSAMLHRAYHAMPGLTNGQNEPIGAVYGFFSMFLSVLSEYKPEYLIVCFDRSKPTIRQSMFAGYHEQRPPMESDLSSQVILIDELLATMGVTIEAADGYEGDDVIGTFATQALREDDLEVIIVTGDRDMLQLVNERTKILMTVTGLTKTVLYDAALVEEKYGVTPKQFIDYKALIGDPSDGYPGITGIGPKTAASLLQQYGTFEALYERLAELPEKTQLKLATDAEQGALAKKLAAIILDAPVHLDLKKATVSSFDFAKLREGFAKHNFKSLITRLEARYPEVILKDIPEDDGQLGLL